MKKVKTSLFLLLSLAAVIIAFAVTAGAATAKALTDISDVLTDANKVYFKVETDKDFASYAVGEEINFTATLWADTDKDSGKGDDLQITAPYFNYVLIHDGNETDVGSETYGNPNTYTWASVAPTDGVVNISTTLSAAGSVRLVIMPADASKTVYTSSKITKFEGGAVANASDIQVSTVEPADFDSFWKEQLAELYGVEPNLVHVEILADNTSYTAYEVRVDCVPSSVPADHAFYTEDCYMSGRMTVPKNADAGSLGLWLNYNGYGTTYTSVVYKAGYIYLDVSIHSIEQNKDKTDSYYTTVKNKLYQYGFQDDLNADPKTSYLRNVLLRDVQAVRFLRTYFGTVGGAALDGSGVDISGWTGLWDGTTVRLSGGSAGGFQCISTAALLAIANDTPVTSVIADVPWLADVAGNTDTNKIKSSFKPNYRAGLAYYDTALMAKRVKADYVLITPGMGDTLCPVASTQAVYNNLSTANVNTKILKLVQGKCHSGTNTYPINSFSCENNTTYSGYALEKDNADGSLNDIKWTFDPATGTLTFKGTSSTQLKIEDTDGDQWNTTVPWGFYMDAVKKIVISDGITSITGWSIFNKHTALETFEIQSSELSVNAGQYMFDGCTALSTVGPAGTPVGTYDLSNFVWGADNTETFFGGCGGGKDLTVILPTDGKRACFGYNWNGSANAMTASYRANNFSNATGVSFDAVSAEALELANKYIGNAPERFKMVVKTLAEGYALAGDNGATNDIKWSFDSEGTLTFFSEGTLNSKTLKVETNWGNTRPWNSHKNSVKKVVIKEGITSITGYKIFREHTALETFEIQSSKLSVNVGNSMFVGCTALSTVGPEGTPVGTYDLSCFIWEKDNTDTFFDGCGGGRDLMVILPIKDKVCFGYNWNGSANAMTASYRANNFSNATSVTFKVVSGTDGETVADLYVTNNSTKFSKIFYTDSELPLYDANATGFVKKYEKLVRSKATGSWVTDDEQSILNDGSNNDLIWRVNSAGTLIISGNSTTLELLPKASWVGDQNQYIIGGSTPWETYKGVIKKVILDTPNLTTIQNGEYMFARLSSMTEFIIYDENVITVNGAERMFIGSTSLSTFGPEGTPENTFDLRKFLSKGCNTNFFNATANGKEITIYLPTGENDRPAVGYTWKNELDAASYPADASKVTFVVAANTLSYTAAKNIKDNNADKNILLIIGGTGSCGDTSYSYSYEEATGTLSFEWTSGTKSFTSKANDVLTQILESYGANIQALKMSGFTDVQLPQIDSLDTINSEMFAGCPDLAAVSIPATYTSLGDNAFGNCTALARMTVFAEDLVISDTAIPDSNALTVLCFGENAYAALNGQNFAYTEVELFDGALDMTGYAVRLETYNGLRALFSFDRTQEKVYSNFGLSLVEVGGIVMSKANYEANGGVAVEKNGLGYAVNTTSAKQVTIWSNGKVGTGAKLLSTTNLDTNIDFAIAVVNYSANYATDVYFCAYSVWVDGDGNEYILYEDYTEYNPAYKFTSLYAMSAYAYETQGVTDNTIINEVLTACGYFENNVAAIANGVSYLAIDDKRFYGTAA